MLNLNVIINEQIRTLAKREITTNTRSTRKATAQFRHAIAALKKQVADLTKRLAFLEQHQPQDKALPPEVLAKARFRAMGVKAHRAKLGLSAQQYAKLVGVSDLSIYQWESGKATPRQAQKAKWLAIRGLGKQEALQRLGLAETKTAPAVKMVAPQRRKPRQFKQTAEEMVLALLKERKMLKTSQLVAQWKKAGRGGAVDNVLGRMVKTGILKRKPLGGIKGSEYRVG